jgi:hypothetical protein
MKIANDWSIACTKSTKNVGDNVGTAKTHCAATPNDHWEGSGAGRPYASGWPQ